MCFIFKSGLVAIFIVRLTCIIPEWKSFQIWYGQAVIRHYTNPYIQSQCWLLCQLHDYSHADVVHASWSWTVNRSCGLQCCVTDFVTWYIWMELWLQSCFCPYGDLNLWPLKTKVQLVDCHIINNSFTQFEWIPLIHSIFYITFIRFVQMDGQTNGLMHRPIVYYTTKFDTYDAKMTTKVLLSII